jgi:hypothetical protein
LRWSRATPSTIKRRFAEPTFTSDNVSGADNTEASDVTVLALWKPHVKNPACKHQ